ncbi:TPA: SdpI family protein [Clostridium perfringens]|uniref:SdpI family protein n=1 Tax=Clostridium perfringens TaxID=1502 RepID=UPI00103E99EF|nr:SdpI family protein [Clostridium perfringens]EJT6473745.1 SdpI family protein [Clostridium perfringens]EJT6479274.1 SdpI family protein [Clostridium perfringens]EJT6531994.1 SdpI family protein [Clostridium perfringens]MBO3378401.1 SdpI family protein [Clostridium perfringens]MCX0361820.1 SdpI family protein [Clostridium perfringens]
MGFWIFMMVMELLIPLIMIIFGKQFSKKAPKEINYFYGYRTSMSMKNKDTWEFAHKYCGRLWLKIGWIMFVVSFIIMLFVFGKSEQVIGTWGGALCMVQMVVLVASIFPTERALRKNFDKYGNRRNV